MMMSYRSHDGWRGVVVRSRAVSLDVPRVAVRELEALRRL